MTDENASLETQVNDEIEEKSSDIREILDSAIDAQSVDETEISTNVDGEQETNNEPAYEGKFNGYSEEQRQQLASLPVDIQKIIDERAEKFHSGIDKYRSESEFAREVNKTLSQERDYLKQQNMEPAQYIQNLVNVERQLRSDNLHSRLQALHAIALSYGVDINALSQVPFDERVYRMEQENIALRQHQESLKYSQESQETDSLIDLVNDFRSTHEHFDSLTNDIQQILSAGMAKGESAQDKIQSAYEMAMRLNGITPATVVNEAKRSNELVQKAKQSAVQVKGAPAAGSVKKVNNTTVYDAVSSAFDALGM